MAKDDALIQDIDLRKNQRPPRQRAKFGPVFFAAAALKILCMVFSGVILGLVREYHDSYMIAVIISVASCTYIYALVSLIMTGCVAWMCSPEDRNCHFLEAFASLLLFCGWLLSAGISIDISLRAGSRTTELFAWVGASCGLTTAIFAMLMVMYGLRVARTALNDANGEPEDV